MVQLLHQVWAFGKRWLPDMYLIRTTQEELIAKVFLELPQDHPVEVVAPTGPPRGPERWRRWKRMLDEGVCRNRAELARVEGVSRAAVTQGLRKLGAVDFMREGAGATAGARRGDPQAG